MFNKYFQCFNSDNTKNKSQSKFVPRLDDCCELDGEVDQQHVEIPSLSHSIAMVSQELEKELYLEPIGDFSVCSLESEPSDTELELQLLRKLQLKRELMRKFHTQSGVEESDLQAMGVPTGSKRREEAVSALDTWLALQALAFQQFSPPTEAETTFETQSGVEGVNMVRNNNITSTATIDFHDQVNSKSYVMDASMDPTRGLVDTPGSDLSSFFSRPLLIRQDEWGTGTTYYQEFDPWSRFIENERNMNRLNNYMLLRAKLHVKFIINGNGFQYGRCIASYLPYANLDTLSVNSALVPQDIVQASQQPHVFLNPTTSSGGDMIIPFFSHTSNVNIVDGDYKDLGRIVIRSINPLKHANGGTDVVTISTFAWLEDVQLGGLTGINAGALFPQSGKETETDEANVKGMISGPATALQEAAMALSSIPTIAPYALATSKAAGMVGAAAKALGYCAPIQTKSADPYRFLPSSSMATVTTPSSHAKLSVDDKQELSIDPRIAGLGSDDPLHIATIARRESYLTTFNWEIGQSPKTFLWVSRVTPGMWASVAGPPTSYHLTSLCVASLPFDYWRGTIRFRFQVVASTFHKGRLRIIYDPKFVSSDEYNLNYSRIVDIAEENDFTIEVGMTQETDFLETYAPGRDPTSNVYRTTPYSGSGKGNGDIGVLIMNELTSPNSTVNNDVQINVFVSAGDDFEVAVPTDEKYGPLVFKPQSGTEIVPEALGGSEADDAYQDKSFDLGNGVESNNHLNKVYFGEKITSMRTLLKRNELHRTVNADINLTQTQQAVNIFPAYPYLRGKVAGAVDTATGGVAYNFCNTLLFHIIQNCFSGWRGSLRWRAQLLYSRDTDVVSMYMQRFKSNGFYRAAANVLPITSAAASRSNMRTPISPLNPETTVLSMYGAAYNNSKQNPVIEVEVPYYSVYRFSPGKVQDVTTLNLWSESVRFHRTYYTPLKYTPANLLFSVGEDYQPYFWTGLPRVYYESSIPLATS